MDSTRNFSYSRNFYFLDFVQKVISIVIALLFFVGLVPFSYNEIGILIIGFVVLQAIISLLRFNIIGFIYELFLLLITILAFIPVLGYVFRVFGILFSLIDILFHNRNSTIVKTIYRGRANLGNKRDDSNNDERVYEAEYREK